MLRNPSVSEKNHPSPLIKVIDLIHNWIFGSRLSRVATSQVLIGLLIFK